MGESNKRSNKLMTGLKEMNDKWLSGNKKDPSCFLKTQFHDEIFILN